MVLAIGIDGAPGAVRSVVDCPVRTIEVTNNGVAMGVDRPQEGTVCPILLI